GLERDRAGLAAGDLQGEVDDLAGAGGDLLIVQGHEDVLGIAAVDAPAFAVEHVNVDEMRVGIDRAVPPESAGMPDASAARAAERGISCAQSSLESTVPWLKRWPRLSVRTTVSTRYLPPDFSRGISGRIGPSSLPSITPPSRSPKRSTRTFSSARNLAWRSAAAVFPSKVASPVLAPMKKWSWISRPPWTSKSRATKSP